MGLGIIDIERTGEDGSLIHYCYEHEGKRGRLSIDKLSGETKLLEAASGEREGRLYHAAAHRVRQAWRTGALPNKLQWAG